MCQDVIIEADRVNDGQDAVYYEGEYQGWLNRGCAGLFQNSFRIVTDSIECFYCPRCVLIYQKKKITNRYPIS